MEQRDGQSQSKRGAEMPWAPTRLEITFPPRSRGWRQLSPKHYLNLHGLGNSPGTPSVVGSHNAGSRQRLCPVGLEKKVKRRWRERRQERKSLGTSSHGWARPGVYVDFLNFWVSAPGMISGGLCLQQLGAGLGFSARDRDGITAVKAPDSTRVSVSGWEPKTHSRPSQAEAPREQSIHPMYYHYC